MSSDVYSVCQSQKMTKKLKVKIDFKRVIVKFTVSTLLTRTILISSTGVHRALLQALACPLTKNGPHDSYVQGVCEEHRRDGAAICGACDGHDRDDLRRDGVIPGVCFVFGVLLLNVEGGRGQDGLC